MADVFLSYSRADQEVANRLAEALKAAGLAVADGSGDASQDPYSHGVAQAACVIVLWSAHAAASAEESQGAIKLALSAWSTDRLVLALLDGAPLPAGLRDLSALRLSKQEPEIGKIVERVKSVIEKRQRLETAEVLAPPAAPPAPSAAKGRRRIYAIIGGLAVLIALVIGFWPLSTDRVGDTYSKGPAAPSSAQAELWPWIVGGGAALVAIGLIWFFRSRFGERARRILSTGDAADATPQGAGIPAQWTAEPGPHQIFISYSRQDTRSVDRIVEHIEGAGYTVWIDREAGGHGTQRYAAPIVRAIKSARLVALMCSRNAFASDHVVREVYVAGDFRKPFLAFQLDQTQFPDDLIYFLSGFPRIPADPVQPEQLRGEIRRYVS